MPRSMPPTDGYPSEHLEQVQLVAMVEAAYPREAAMLFAIPNGGDRDVLVAVKLKKEGVRRGVPDMFLALARGGWHGLFIEMKRRRGGVVSPEQAAYIEALRAQGYRAEVCKGCDEALEVLRDYLSAKERG